MQKSTRNDLWSGKSFWNEVVREGVLMSPGAAMIKVVLPRQLGLQIRAADVSIRVRRNGTPVYGNGVIIRGR